MARRSTPPEGCGCVALLLGVALVLGALGQLGRLLTGQVGALGSIAEIAALTIVWYLGVRFVLGIDLADLIRWRVRKESDIVVIAPPIQGTPGAREYIAPRLRFAVLQRDGFRCVYCGRSTADGVSLEVDHLVPVAAGGRTEIDNLAAACFDCNRSKAARHIIDV